MKLIIAIGLLLTLSARPVLAGSSVIGRIVSARGEISRSNSKGVIDQLKKGQRIYRGDVIETPKGGFVKILMRDDTLFQLGPKSKMEFEKFVFTTKKKRSAVYSLVRGKLRSLFTVKTNLKTLKIKTPNASMAIRGTEILSDVYMQEGKVKTDIALVSGRLEVDYPAQEQKKLSSVILRPGEYIQFARVPGPELFKSNRPVVKKLPTAVFESVRTFQSAKSKVFLHDALEENKKRKPASKVPRKTFDFELPPNDLSVKNSASSIKAAKRAKLNKLLLASTPNIAKKIASIESLKGEKKIGKFAKVLGKLISQKTAQTELQEDQPISMMKIWQEIKKDAVKKSGSDFNGAKQIEKNAKIVFDKNLNSISKLQNRFYKKLDEGTLGLQDKETFRERMLGLRKEKNIATDRLKKAQEYTVLMGKWKQEASTDPGSYALKRSLLEEDMAAGQLTIGATLRNVEQTFELAGGADLPQKLQNAEDTFSSIKLRKDQSRKETLTAPLFTRDMTELTFKRDYSFGAPSFEFVMKREKNNSGRTPAAVIPAGRLAPSTGRTPASTQTSIEEGGEYGRASREVKKINRSIVIAEAEEKARIIARSIAEDAAEKAALKAAERVALPAAMTVAKKAAFKEASKVANLAASKAADKAAAQAAESVAYTSGGLASALEQKQAREAVKKAARQAAKGAASNVAGRAARRAAESASRRAAIVVARKAARTAANRAALDAVETAMERITAESGWGPDDFEARRAAKLAALKVAKQAA
ncbi:MAG: FecR domain-containing protein, partial [Halobacteriovoraceae bacterium]|nr:FecR domain-containing protein [Halobacteriovoraceae bacterium]